MAVRTACNGARVPELRWSSLFSQLSSLILMVVTIGASSARELEKYVERTILQEAVDPNVGRKLLRERVGICSV